MPVQFGMPYRFVHPYIQNLFQLDHRTMYPLSNHLRIHRTIFLLITGTASYFSSYTPSYLHAKGRGVSLFRILSIIDVFPKIDNNQF